MLNAIKKPVQAFRRSRLHQQELNTDARRGIETTVKLSGAASDEATERVHYEPFQYSALRQLDAHLPVGERDVIYDLGCGLGRVVCHFARKGVGGVVGVEYDAALSKAAQANIERMKDRRAPARVVQGDAATVDCSDATVVFMYNPFGADTMRRVLAGLPATRGMKIAYANPRQIEVFGEFPEFREVARFQAPYNLRQMGVVIWERS
jgi:trans-aconitate methyltransferase